MKDRNQERFARLHQNLKDNANLPDSEVFEALDNIQLMTNSEFAAFRLAILLAPIGAYRPHLTNHLLSKLLFPLLLTGFDNAQQVVVWIKSHLESPNPFDGLRPEGLDWLKWLITQPGLIQQVLDQLIHQCKEQDANEIREYFAPFCRIPLDKVKFYTYWSDEIISKGQKRVLFIQISSLAGQEEAIQERRQRETLRKFELLTEAIAKHDMSGEIALSVLNWEGYYDLLRVFEHTYSGELFLGEEITSVQIVWIFKGKGFRVIREDIENDAVIEEYTSDLAALPRNT